MKKREEKKEDGNGQCLLSPIYTRQQQQQQKNVGCGYHVRFSFCSHPFHGLCPLVCPLSNMSSCNHVAAALHVCSPIHPSIRPIHAHALLWSLSFFLFASIHFLLCLALLFPLGVRTNTKLRTDAYFEPKEKEHPCGGGKKRTCPIPLPFPFPSPVQSSPKTHTHTQHTADRQTDRQTDMQTDKQRQRAYAEMGWVSVLFPLLDPPNLSSLPSPFMSPASLNIQRSKKERKKGRQDKKKATPCLNMLYAQINNIDTWRRWTTRA
ncbi:MAG: hypothetical protein BYD32DRAFT_192377 [Podila humilis]|nr:MAG: hypothetical protein BYD32DRAFT_192377 [Podila humilis]